MSVLCIRQKEGWGGEEVPLLQTLAQLCPFKMSGTDTRWLLALPAEGVGSFSSLPCSKSMNYLNGDVLNNNTGNHGWACLEVAAKCLTEMSSPALLLVCTDRHSALAVLESWHSHLQHDTHLHASAPLTGHLPGA